MMRSTSLRVAVVVTIAVVSLYVTFVDSDMVGAPAVILRPAVAFSES